jgi:hypothetical protein
MRYLIRILIFWAIAAPLFYWFGMPYLVQRVETQAKAENTIACQRQLVQSGLIAQFGQKRGDSYCDCLNEGLHFTSADLLTMARTRKAPANVEAALNERVNECSNQLQIAAPNAPPPETRHTDGSVEVNF